MVSEESQRGSMFFRSMRPCPYCKGTGTVISTPCPECGGTGIKQVRKTQTIDIPKGAFHGASIRLDGLGDAPLMQNGVNGDLIVTFIVEDNPKFFRKENDIYTVINVDMDEAWFGCDKVVDCPDGTTVRIRVPELSKSGTQLSVKGKGIPNIRDGYATTGNLVVRIEYNVPKNLTDRQKEILKEFYKIEKEKK